MMVGSEIRLNLGARDRAIPGFLSVDCDPHQGVDIVADVSDLSQFADGSVQEIVASHILEHFPSSKTLPVLKEWHRVLKNGGILYIGVPDFKRAVEIYAERGLCDWVQNWLWGDQGYATAFHYVGFDAAKLKAMVLEAGFSEVSIVDDLPVRAPKDCSSLISTLDGKPVSLNAVCVR